MSEVKVYPVPDAFAANALIDEATYDAMYKQSVEDPDTFWTEQANRFLTWEKPFTKVCEYDFEKGQAAWFEDGQINVSVNCLDRHLETRGDQVALIWEGDDPEDDTSITYRELHAKVCNFANILKARGVKRGDRVCIYMPMILEAAYAMLA